MPALEERTENTIAERPRLKLLPRRPGSPFRHSVSWMRRTVVEIVIDVLVAIVLIALVWAVWDLAAETYSAILGRNADAFRDITLQILTVFVFIEIFQSLADYMRYRRVSVTTLVDASLAFVLREVWVVLYGGEFTWDKVLPLAILILALGAVRTLAVVFSPKRELQAKPLVAVGGE